MKPAKLAASIPCLLALLMPYAGSAQANIGAKTTGGWSKHVTRSRMDDSTEERYALSSSDGTAYLILVCSAKPGKDKSDRGVKDIYIGTEKYLDPSDYAVARIRIDKEAALTALGTLSTNYKSWFFSNNQIGIDYYALIYKMLQANNLLVQLPIFQSADRVWEFHPRGLNMGEFKRECGIPPEEVSGPDQAR